MSKLWKVLSILIVLLMAMPASVVFAHNGDEPGGNQEHTAKGNPHEWVTICHKPGTPAEQTMSVPEPAVPGHLGHGDYLGACDDGGDDDGGDDDGGDDDGGDDDGGDDDGGGENPGGNNPGGNTPSKTRVYFNCTEALSVVLTVDGVDLMTINLETGNKTNLTEGLPGDFFHGSYSENACPSIFAAFVDVGVKNSDVVQLDMTTTGLRILRSTLTFDYAENLIDYGNDGIYHTRGNLATNIFFQDYKGAESQLVVKGGSNSHFAVTNDGRNILAYELNGNIYVQVNNESAIKVGPGKNPVVHPNGRVVFFKDGEMHYTYGVDFKPSHTTQKGTDVSFNADGTLAVFIIEGEAWLYAVEDSDSGLMPLELKQLTNSNVDGVVSHPDIYTPVENGK